MTVVEFLVVYLSAGAPFGVLVFFSSGFRTFPIAVLRGFIASLVWPLLALSWTHKKLLRRGITQSAEQVFPDGLKLSRDPQIAEYLTLTYALHQSKEHAIGLAIELFEISGHTNPPLAALCSARQRNALLERRQSASAAAFRQHLEQEYHLEPELIADLAGECRRLGDHQTADLIDLPLTTEMSTNSSARLVESARLAA